MLDLGEEGVVTLEPEFQVGHNAPDHGKFSLLRVGQVDLDVALADIRIDPGEDFFGLVEKDHVFIDDEVPVMAAECRTGIDYGLGVGVSLVTVVILLQLHDLLVFELIYPDLLKAGLGFAQDDLGGTLDVLLFSLAVELAVLLGLYGDFDADFVTLLHQ